MEQITIKAVVINQLKSSQDITGEWNANINLDFMLSEASTFTVFGHTYTVDRINLSSNWWVEELLLTFATANETLPGLNVPEAFIQLIMEKVVEEQKEGKSMQGWSLEDALNDMMDDIVAI